MRKSKADLVRGWLEKARRDLLTAERGLYSEEPLTDIVCFHAQQAAEKYLKAYLVWQEIEFPKTHALEDLVLLATQKDTAAAGLQSEVANLTPYAVETRYPEFRNRYWKTLRRPLILRRRCESWSWKSFRMG